ncbi:hypothetical protein BKA81DRAFT_398483 [Phyllosticta paracitricarpa]
MRRRRAGGPGSGKEAHDDLAEAPTSIEQRKRIPFAALARSNAANPDRWPKPQHPLTGKEGGFVASTRGERMGRRVCRGFSTGRDWTSTDLTHNPAEGTCAAQERPWAPADRNCGCKKVFGAAVVSANEGGAAPVVAPLVGSTDNFERSACGDGFLRFLARSNSCVAQAGNPDCGIFVEPE